MYADYCGVEHNHDIDADQDDHDYSIISSAISDDSCKIKPPIMIPVEKLEASVWQLSRVSKLGHIYDHNW